MANFFKMAKKREKITLNIENIHKKVLPQNKLNL